MSDLKFSDIKFPPIRRIGAEHYTEHDFEMERIGAEQRSKTYEERLAVLEAHGWVPFNGPFYYARREFHGGYHPPGTKKRVPTPVAILMFKEENPDVELPEYKPHPHGWTPPPAPGPKFTTEPVSVEPMKVPEFKLYTMKYMYGTKEEEHERDERKARYARWEAFCAQFPGTRNVAHGTTRNPDGGPALDAVFVTLEDDTHLDQFPDKWEGRVVRVEVKPEAEERAEKEARDKAARERYEEEAAWLRKARGL